MNWKGYWLRLLLLCTLFASPGVYAELPSWLRAFPLSQSVQDVQSPAPDYRLILSSILKINGLIRADHDMRLNGKLQRMTWQLPPGYSPQDGFRYMRSQLLSAHAEILFECSGRQCGASNVWANDLFHTSRLYGIDESQYYLAARKGNTHVVIYAIRRGNGRVFLHLELLTAEQHLQAGESWVSNLMQQGYADLPDWPDAPELGVKRLVALLRENPGIGIYIVVHQAGRDVELALRQSRELAQRLGQGVIDQGVDPQRVKTFGVGPLSPEALGGREQLAVIILVKELP